MYKQVIDFLTGATSNGTILRLSDNTYIPFDPANTDYQEYLRWLAEGNQPEPADQGEQ